MSNNFSSAFNEEQAADALLRESVSKLQAEGKRRAAEEYGLTDRFRQGEISQEEAVRMCERAMDSLAEQYVAHLSEFQQAEDPIEILSHLEQSEIIWNSETTVIRHFDSNGEEGAFLDQMRQLALRVTENKLIAMANKTSKHATAENIACCLGLLGVVDQIYSEYGYAKDSAERQKFRSIARSFQV